MIRQSNTQTYVKVFYYTIPQQLSIVDIPELPYYNNYNPIKLIVSNNNNNLIYGNRKE